MELKKKISAIKLESAVLTKKTDEELNCKIEALKKPKKKFLDKDIIEWFALVQEISYRTIGLKHYDTQLLAGFLLNEGKVVEMKTGEGKTLVSTLPVSLNALSKKGAHVVTVNDYLAERDQNWMGKVYKNLGLSVGLVKSTTTLKEKQKSYNSDITYITNSELVFDYLRDNSVYNSKEIVQRELNFCLIDEIDSILIDESRTPLILSDFEETESIYKLYVAKNLINLLKKEEDFEIDTKRRDINLTEKGYQVALAKLRKKSLYDVTDPWMLYILNALKAKYFFKKNKDYIILQEKIAIVDEFTGRVMEDRRWSMGLHEAIEMKENIKIEGGSKTKTSITYQNFFTLYSKLSGMTGTAKTTEKEFQDIYNLEVVVLPTIKPMLRQDLSDLIYQNELAKWKAVLSKSKNAFEKGQPILIGTTTIEKSDFLSDLFKSSNIPHQILNAKPENVKRESEIIAQAGKKNSVTIATNMAGRGTDIILGGNPIFKVKEKIWDLLINLSSDYTPEDEKHIQKILYLYKENIKDLKSDIKKLPDLNSIFSKENKESELENFYKHVYKKIYPVWQKENKEVQELGGLFVLGTERHETRRIDNQLRGRAGRQGDPGISQFLVSLEDDLIKIFAGDSIRRWIDYLLEDKDVPLESSLLSKSLEKAQQKVEMQNYDIRKNVFQYDEILNFQRKELFEARKEILSKNNCEDLFLRYKESLLDEIIEKIDRVIKTKGISLLYETKHLAYIYSKLDLITKNKKKLYKEIWINHDLRFAQSNFYQIGFLKNTRAVILLEIIDFYWTEHIDRMNYIRDTINWRAYGQENPLLEYNIQAYNSFKVMLEEMRGSMIYYFLNNEFIQEKED